MWLWLIKSHCLFSSMHESTSNINNIASFIKHLYYLLSGPSITLLCSCQHVYLCNCFSEQANHSAILKYLHQSIHLLLHLSNCDHIFYVSSSSHVVLGVVFPSLPIRYQQMVQTWQTFMNKSSPCREEEAKTQYGGPPHSRLLLHIEGWRSLRAAYIMTKATFHPQQIAWSHFAHSMTHLEWMMGSRELARSERLNLNKQSTSKKPQSRDRWCRWGRWREKRWTFAGILTNGGGHLRGSARRSHVARFILARKWGRTCGAWVMTALGIALSTVNRRGEL